MDASPDARWILGLNSLIDAPLLRPGEYPWALNIDNAGGIIQTRQGFNAVGCKDSPLPSGKPKGMAIFKGRDGITQMIVAVGGNLYALKFPIVKDFARIGIGFHADTPVVFTKTAQSVSRSPDGSLKVLDEPIPYLIMQNGVERPKYWDGHKLRTVPLTISTFPGMPIGTWMQWSGQRLWVGHEHKLRASDLGNPLVFQEETFVSGGGIIPFDDRITGMTQTADFQNLIVATDYDTFAIQSNVLDRTQWGNTPGFMRVIFAGVGCAAGKSFVRQWGMTWWYSHGGWVGIDQALITYQRSRIQYRDQQMMRSKARLNGDKSKICAGKFGNYLLVAVPYADKDNSATWVLNQRVLDITAPTPLQDAADPASWTSQWTGIQPVEFQIAVIDGQERLFALSRHIGLNGRDHAIVWELFTGERQDRYNDHVYHPPCLLETRLLAFSDEMKIFHYAEIDVSELLGIVKTEALFAGRKGNYRKIMDKQIVASPGSVNAPITSQAVTQLTAPFHETDPALQVQSTAGFLAAPASVNCGGRVFTYDSKDATSFHIQHIIPPPPPQPQLPGKLIPVVFDPPGGDFDVGLLSLVITTPEFGANLSYTTDGSIPSRTNGTIVTGNRVVVSLKGTATYAIQAMAFLTDQPERDSDVTSDVYNVNQGPIGIEVAQPSVTEYQAPDFLVEAPITLNVGDQVIQPQFQYPHPVTILTSYVPQRRMLRTEEVDIAKDECSACGIESPFLDNIDRGFSLLITWRGRMAINALRIMTAKAPEQFQGRCEPDEKTARSVDAFGCGSKSDVIIEVPTLDSSPRQSQYLAATTQANLPDEPYVPVPFDDL